MGIPVGDIAPALEPIDLPDRLAADGETAIPGRKNVPVCEFTLRMKQLAAKAEQGDDDAALALMRACVPSITDEELAALTDGQQLWIVTYCARRLEQVTAALKNVGRAVAASPTARSAPTTKTPTPSPASPAPSARTGSRKPSGRSGRPSSLSIG